MELSFVEKGPTVLSRVGRAVWCYTLYHPIMTKHFQALVVEVL
jgi:hypothetical protein